MGKEIEPSILNLTQCFLCNGWTPTELLRLVILEESQQKICVSCHRKLVSRMRALKLEAIKESEDNDPDEETKAAFGSTQFEED